MTTVCLPPRASLVRKPYDLHHMNHVILAFLQVRSMSREAARRSLSRAKPSDAPQLVKWCPTLRGGRRARGAAPGRSGTARRADISKGGLAPFLGLGLYWAWVALVFYSRVLVPGGALAASGSQSQLVDTLWLWATWSHMLGLVLIVVASRRVRSLASGVAARIAPAFCVAAGTALIPMELVFLGPESPICQPLVLATAVVMGLASAWLVLQWAEAYGRLRLSTVAAASTLSFALGLAVYFVCFAFPPVIAAITAALLPLGSLLALLECRKHLVAAGDCDKPSARSVQVGPGVSPLALALPIVSVFVFALCGEMLRAFSLSIAGASVDSMGAIYLVGGLVGLAALSAYVLVPKRATAGEQPAQPRRFTIPLLRGVFLFMAAAFLVAPFLVGSALAVSYGIFGAGFWCFRAITWAVCFSLCRKRGVRPMVAIGVLDAAYALSVVVGSSLNGWLTEALKVGTTEITTVSLVAVFALMFMALFVLNGSDVRAILDSGIERAQDTDGVEGAEGVDVRGVSSAATEDASGAEAVKDAAAENAAGASPASPPASGHVPHGSRVDATTTVPRSQVGVVAHGDEAAFGGPSGFSASGQAAGMDLVAATVSKLAAAHGLTPREAEVAALLAKGRSLPFVQDELFISAGTAQTHARHIYKKLGVHSRQELIDLVERSSE